MPPNRGGGIVQTHPVGVPSRPSTPLTSQRLVSAKPSLRSMSVPSDLHRGRPPELAARILCAAISGLPTPVVPGSARWPWPLRDRSQLQGPRCHLGEPAWGREANPSTLAKALGPTMPPTRRQCCPWAHANPVVVIQENILMFSIKHHER